MSEAFEPPFFESHDLQFFSLSFFFEDVTLFLLVAVSLNRGLPPRFVSFVPEETRSVKLFIFFESPLILHSSD